MYLPQSTELTQISAYLVSFLLEDSKEVLYPSSVAPCSKRSSVLWLTHGLTHACGGYTEFCQQMSIPSAPVVLSVQPTDLQSFNQIPFTRQHPVNDLKCKATLFAKKRPLQVEKQLQVHAPSPGQAV